jgi:hypothetical protein
MESIECDCREQMEISQQLSKKLETLTLHGIKPTKL